MLAAAALLQFRPKPASDAPAAVQKCSLLLKASVKKANLFLRFHNGYRKELGKTNPWRSRQIFSGTERKVAWASKTNLKKSGSRDLRREGEAKDQVTKWMNDTFGKKKEWIRLKPGLTTSRPVPRKSYRSARPLPPIHALSVQTRWTNGRQVTARRSMSKLKGLETPPDRPLASDFVGCQPRSEC